MTTALDAVFLAGCVAVVVGVTAFDWRIGLIVAGVMALVCSLAGMTKHDR